MDHVVVLLDQAHAEAATRLAGQLARPAGPGDRDGATIAPHITLVSFDGVTVPAALEVLAPVVAAAAPFRVRAHGYGIFSGSEPRDLSLHVMVVRSRALDRLQATVRRALGSAGARIDGLTEPEVWTPHITLLDHDLTPARLARAVEELTGRPHRSWSEPVDALVVCRGRHGQPARLALGGNACPEPRSAHP